MYVLAPMPIFTTTPVPTSADMSPWDHHTRRPAQPSSPSMPTSSPLRASSSSSPLAPRDENTLLLPHRDALSSPIRAPQFKFANMAAAARRVPVIRKREEVQERRRNLFLRNVRQRADDRVWERRDIENTILKSEWQREVNLWQSQLAAVDSFPVGAEIEDEPLSVVEEAMIPDEMDDVFVDDIAQQEEQELDAMIASYLETSTPDAPLPEEPRSSLSDDEDYDQLFMDIVSSQDVGQPDVSSQDVLQQMDMS